jgi:membrane fusion protein (multidrug efflux system)
MEPRVIKKLASYSTQIVVVIIVGGAAYWAWQNPDSLPFFGGESADSAASAERPPTPVDVATAREGSVVVSLEAIGNARANEAVTVMSDVMGIVEKINFDEGEMVEQGAVLINFDSSILDAQVAVRQAEIEVRKAELENARQLFERAKRLLETQNVPASRYDELAASLKAAQAGVKSAQAELAAIRAQLAKRQVTAPFSGRLGIRDVSVGRLIEPGDPIVTLDDISVIKLDFQVPERSLAQLKVGQEITSITDAYPGRVFFGVVQSIGSRVDPVTRAVAVRAKIDNSDEALKPGMFLLVELGVATRNSAVLIPEEAVVSNGTERYVFVVADGVIRQSPVALGQRLPGEVEVLEGVVAGEQVVVGGVQKVREGAKVAIRQTDTTEQAAATK